MASRAMASPRPATLVLAALAGGSAFFSASQLFTGPALPVPTASRVARAARNRGYEGLYQPFGPDTYKKEGEPDEVTGYSVVNAQRLDLYDWGINLNGDKLDNLEEYYEEALIGKGGMPEGSAIFLKDLILKSYFVRRWDSSGFPGQKDRNFTGPNFQPSEADFEKALRKMRSNIAWKKHFVGKDDGSGWTWLVAHQSPGGLTLVTHRSPPFGQRPLALIKDGDVEKFFVRVYWPRLFMRLHKFQLWGGKARQFPYPVRMAEGFQKKKG
mmetsp:Transcript_17880/g.49055  ORF Transcript_17880/g.49055 Transcript_17880/m.49055 type:complete len:269 (-) Transcript_17880:161-967(-)